MTIKSVGIVGYGAYGTLLQILIARFAPEVAIKVYSRHHTPDDQMFFSLEEVAACDAVFLAVPIHALEENLKKLVPLINDKTTLVDVSTVKKYPGSLLKKYAKGKSYVATHPMWGPESYKKKGGDVSGFRIVITDSTVPEESILVFCKTLEHLGFTCLRMSADAHDKHLAETLFLTHFIGQIVSHAKFDRTEIDTVSFRYLMDAVESVRHDKALFQDVFRYDPYCKKVLKKFGIAEKSVQQLLNQAKEN